MAHKRETKVAGKLVVPEKTVKQRFTLSEIVKSAQTGLACGDRVAGDAGVRQIRMNSFAGDGRVDLNGSVRIPSRLVTDRHTLQSGDLVFNNTNSYELVGRAALVRELDDEIVSFSNHITRLRFDERKCLPGYVSDWIQNQWREGKLKRIVTRFVGQSSISTEALLQLTIDLPDFHRQRKVRELLAAVDDVIIESQNTIDQLTQGRSALMKSLMLPSKRTLQRFEKSKLGRLFGERREPGEPGLPTLSVTMHDGMVDRKEHGRRVTSDLSPEEHLLAHKDDIAYNMMRMWQGVSGLAPHKGLVSPAYVVLRPLDGIDPLFASYLFKLPETIRLFHRYSQGLTNDRLRLYYDQFAEIKVSIPSDVAEQRRIAALLTTFDEQIERAEAVIESLKRTKASICQEIFQ